MLKRIDLRRNHIGSEGWCAIFNALRDNKDNKIEEWDLSREDINVEIAKALAEYVSGSAVLKKLNLLSNRLDDAEKQALREDTREREDFELLVYQPRSRGRQSD